MPRGQALGITFQLPEQDKGEEPTFRHSRRFAQTQGLKADVRLVHS